MSWKSYWKKPVDRPTLVRAVIVTVVAGGLVAFSILFFGLYNVSARSGHWPGISWLLHTTFRNTAALRARAEPPADFGSQDMVKLGAGHFDSACKQCHGAPGEERSATVRAMVPEPPDIVEAVSEWDPRELHWIVHEGIKMTGMPGWPAERDDEVWAVVSFLMAVPDMDADAYGKLTGKPGGQYCAMCHNTTGISGNGHIPRLDMLSEDYIAASLSAFKSGTRESGIMAEAVSHIEEQDIADIAARYAAIPPSGPGEPLDETATRGRQIAENSGRHDVPSCHSCHGPWPEKLNPLFPSLAGQYAPYIEQQLKLWREKNRGGTKASELMHHAARALDDGEIAALAAYYAAMAPARLNAGSE